MTEPVNDLRWTHHQREHEGLKADPTITVRESDLRWSDHHALHDQVKSESKEKDISLADAVEGTRQALANSLQTSQEDHQRVHDLLREDTAKKDDAMAHAVENTRSALANSLRVALEDHQRMHDQIRTDQREREQAAATSLKVALEDHHREHVVHDNAHGREHEATATALDKAEKSMDKRLEGMNEFRQQLNNQAATFLSRDLFDRYAKEVAEKHDATFNNLRTQSASSITSGLTKHEADIEVLRKDLQIEREIRKTFEGSVNTFKYLVGLVGASGIAGILYLLANTPT